MFASIPLFLGLSFIFVSAAPSHPTPKSLDCKVVGSGILTMLADDIYGDSKNATVGLSQILRTKDSFGRLSPTLVANPILAKDDQEWEFLSCNASVVVPTNCQPTTDDTLDFKVFCGHLRPKKFGKGCLAASSSNTTEQVQNLVLSQDCNRDDESQFVSSFRWFLDENQSSFEYIGDTGGEDIFWGETLPETKSGSGPITLVRNRVSKNDLVFA